MPAAGPSDHPDSAANGRETTAERVSAGHSVAEFRLRELAALIAASPHNLVARGERTAVYERHVLDCVALGDQLAPTGRWMDLGTGGGLPGLVLAVQYPQVQWTLVDATAKKVAAVEGFATALQLTNVTAITGRAERLAREPEHRGWYDGVVARAVAPLRTLAELARGFLRPGGVLVALKGPAAPDEVRDARTALRRLRFRVSTIEPLSSGARQNWLVTMRAEGDPPAGYPRRDGVPKNDPLR